MNRKWFVLCFAFLVSFTAVAQQQKTAMPIPYGEPIRLEQAEKIMAAAVQEAIKNNWTMAIAIVDAGGNLVLFKKTDNTQLGSIDVAIGKAKTANNFKRPTKVLEDAIANGGVGLRILSLSNTTALEGGELIIVDGKIIGAIGVSGAQSTQDDQVAKAGLAALN